MAAFSFWVTDPGVLEDVGVVPDFGDDGGGVIGHEIDGVDRWDEKV